jgi:hypothetical protein
LAATSSATQDRVRLAEIVALSSPGTDFWVSDS